MSIPQIDSMVHQANRWLKELTEAGHFRDTDEAYAVLRVVLHALRDRLTPDEAVDLAAQLPTVIRGVYFEGWRPVATPKRQRTRDEFLAAIAERLADPVDPQRAAHAVFALLEMHVTAGEIQDVRQMLPADIRALWPQAA